ncbi:undecaprenyl-phosphate 4-deoxy-4-formamido-L-arabinose transferase [Lachnospiraceae bacterium]|nr:undecaprenyl-phosphate 4-deoxy-4-formamido-L-arabinose transferase [Lachnospiraceae bacterium]
MSIYDEKLSIVMPAYNEGKKIYNNLLKTVEIVGGFHKNFEIVAVNDGSVDNTEKEIKRAEEADRHIIAVSYTPNGGKGKAIKEGVLKATGDYIAFLDSDLDLSPNHLDLFLSKMEETGAEAVIGSKLHKDSRVDYPKRRKVMSVGYYVILVILFHLPVKDTQTGVKLFRGDILKRIIPKVHSTGYAYDIEILANISRLGGKIEEMPIVLEFQRENRWGRIRMKDIWQVTEDTIKVFKAIHRKR